MPVQFHILQNRGLVYVRYDGFAGVHESFEAFGRYVQHPDMRPGQRQLVDLSGITGFEHNYAQLFEFQARKVDVFLADGPENLIVYYAPNELTLRLARLVERSWAPFSGVVVRVQQNEPDTLALLGQHETSFAQLLQAA